MSDAAKTIADEYPAVLIDASVGHLGQVNIGFETPIPNNDLWIAALVLRHRMPLLTFDAHFRLVPGITIA